MKRFTKERHIGDAAFVASQKSLNGAYSTHLHEFFEIEYFTEGSGVYVVDGVEYAIRPGMLFLMTPLHFHSVRAKDCRVYNVMFSETLCDVRFLSCLLESGAEAVFEAQGSEKEFLDVMLRELVQNLSKERYASYLLNAILGKLSARRTACRGLDAPTAKGVLYLIEHFRGDPSLAEVAEYAGYAPTYFSALFKKETGVTFREYLDRLRFDHAKKLIETSDMTVIQVCRESGFSDYPNFVRRFKQRFGTSPGEWRTRIGG